MLLKLTRRQRDWVVRTSNPEVTDLSLALIAKLELFLSRPDFNISAMFVNSQLVCLSPAGTFNHVMLCSFALITFFSIWLFKFTLFSWLACASCDRFDFRTMKVVFQTINQNTRNWLNSKIIFGSQHIIRTEIGQFRYIKIQPKTIDLRTRLWGVTIEIVGFISPEPCAEVYCVRLNFDMSKSVYWNHRSEKHCDSTRITW